MTLPRRPAPDDATLATRRIHTGRVINLDIDRVRFPDGSEGELEMIRHPGASAVVPGSRATCSLCCSKCLRIIVAWEDCMFRSLSVKRTRRDSARSWSICSLSWISVN